MRKKLFQTRKILMTALFMLASLSSEARNSTENTYALATDKSASKRLDAQHALLAESATKHLKKAGLSKGQIVWDVGCSNGAMTVYLAKMVGEKGHVYAIDTKEELLKIAQDKVKAQGFTNVTFIQGDIRSHKDLPIGNADIVYMRFVLMHEKDPASMISGAKNLLKKGGVIVSQESIMSTAHSSPEYQVFRDYVHTLVALGEKLGVDYNIGNRLTQLYTQVGFDNISIDYIQQKLTISEVKKILPLSLAGWKNRAIEVGVTTPEKIEAIDQSVKNWPDNDKDFYFAPSKQAYLLAWKEK